MKWENISVSKDNEKRYNIPENWIFPYYYEGFNLFFKFENSLRLFVYIILKNKFKEKWKDISLTSDDKANTTINSIARTRLSQLKKQSYLGYNINNPIVYLSTGELFSIISNDSYWKFFNKYFNCSKSILIYKLDELITFRNTLAHFRPIKEKDIAYCKITIEQIFEEVNLFLDNVLNINIKFPNNNKSIWYKTITSLNSSPLKLNVYKTKNGEWVKVSISYILPILDNNEVFVGKQYKFANLNSINLCNKFTSFCNSIIYLTEDINIINATESELKVTKILNFIVSKTNLENSKYLSNLVATLNDVKATMAQDYKIININNENIGEILEPINIHIDFYKNSVIIDEKKFLSDTKENNTLEFWGHYKIHENNFIVNAHYYPWIDIQTGLDTYPF